MLTLRPCLSMERGAAGTGRLQAGGRGGAGQQQQDLLMKIRGCSGAEAREAGGGLAVWTRSQLTSVTRSGENTPMDTGGHVEKIYIAVDLHEPGTVGMSSTFHALPPQSATWSEEGWARVFHRNLVLPLPPTPPGAAVRTA